MHVWKVCVQNARGCKKNCFLQTNFWVVLAYYNWRVEAHLQIREITFRTPSKLAFNETKSCNGPCGYILVVWIQFIIISMSLFIQKRSTVHGFQSAIIRYNYASSVPILIARDSTIQSFRPSCLPCLLLQPSPDEPSERARPPCFCTFTPRENT